MMTPVYDWTKLAWACGAKLKKDIGSDWTSDRYLCFYVCEELAEERGMTAAELGEELIREHIETPEFVAKWLS